MWVTYNKTTKELVGLCRKDIFVDSENLEEIDVLVDLEEMTEWLPDKLRFKRVPKSVTTRTFLGMFSLPERISFRQQALTDVVLEDMLWLLAETDTVSGSDTAFIEGLGYLVTKGIISLEKMETIKVAMGVE